MNPPETTAVAAAPAGRWNPNTVVVTVLPTLIAFAGGLAQLYGVLLAGPVGTRRWLDIGIGALACFVLLFRRHARTRIAIGLAVVAAFVTTAGVANMVALYGVARYRQLTVAVAVGVGNVVSGYVFWLFYPGNSKLSLTLTVNVAMVAAIVSWGAMRQTQERLLESYRERAERAEREQLLHENQVRQAERTRIAREMHDVITHRISLVALHAGGLMVDPDPKITDVRDSAELIYGSARQALDELRQALGALRADEPISLEQPGLHRIGDLVTDATRAGQRVELTMDPDIVEQAPSGVGRDAYRIVQEGLANVRKHAPDAVAVVTIAVVDDRLRVAVGNDLAEGSLGVPGAGTGLIGLAERADLAGGTLRHGVVAGRFELVGELPWT